MKAAFINKTGENIANLMRRARYHYLGTDSNTGQMNFVHPLGQNPYPRFHAYLKENPLSKEVFFNLHLDQKKPIYKGAPHAHSAEYEGEVVEREAERIKNFFADSYE